MIDKNKLTSSDMIRELHQVVIGIPQNPHDNGLIGRIEDIAQKLDKLNNRVRGNEVRSKVNQSIIGVISGGIIALYTKILNLW